jgi:hypothetical protein
MIQDVQWHPVEEQILHIDFLKIEADKPVKIGVPVKLVGTAKGIKAGGKLKVNMRQLRVKALLKIYLIPLKLMLPNWVLATVLKWSASARKPGVPRQ